MKALQEMGIEVEILGVKRDNYTIPEYKAAMQATEELTAELESLLQRNLLWFILYMVYWLPNGY